MDQATDLSPIELACEAAGSQAELARRVQESPSLINQWVKKRRPIPNDKGPAIEYAVGGVVTVEQLLPLEKWTRIHDERWPHPEGRPVIDPERERSAGDPSSPETAAPTPQPSAAA